jgi:IS30 family transposase
MCPIARNLSVLRSDPSLVGLVQGSAELRRLLLGGDCGSAPLVRVALPAAATRRRRTRPLKLSVDSALRAFVVARLGERWSPEQIARALGLAHPTDRSARVSTETIYQEIYRPHSGIIRTPDPSPLRTGRDHRRGQSRQVRTRRRFAQPMLSVHDRGFEPTDRSVARHWEGDLIVGPHNRSAIGALVERRT